MGYIIIFNDGGTLRHKGSINIGDREYLCYNETNIIKYRIPIRSVKYIENCS